ncbi:MAG: four helix bundle protein [Actinobacteria bacterium]|nr:four helix bundle protein [Actinomycetota bacterium]
MKCHTLDVWKRSKELAVRIYKSEMQGPFAKDFSLIRQIQRSAVSICSNIAEGAERGSSKDSAHFYTMAKGSAAELATQLAIAQEIGLSVEKRILETEEIARMLNSLIKSVKAKGSKQ